MSSRQSDLLAALQRKSTPPAATAVPLPKPDAPPVPELSLEPAEKPAEPPRAAAVPPATAVKPRRVGKPVQFWLHEEDRKLVRELAAWLAGQGIRPTDSMVVRASLRMAKPGSAFLEAYRKASLLDGRLKQP